MYLVARHVPQTLQLRAVGALHALGAVALGNAARVVVAIACAKCYINAMHEALVSHPCRRQRRPRICPSNVTQAIDCTATRTTRTAANSHSMPRQHGLQASCIDGAVG